MPDYDGLRSTTERLIRNFGSGRMATFYRWNATYDPIADADTGAAETPYDVLCTVVPRGAGDISTPYDDRSETESVKIIVPALGLAITPQTGDTVAIPGRPGRFAVTDCKPVAPDGDNIVYLVNAERGATSSPG